MDEQNPRVGGDRTTGRGDEAVTGYDRSDKDKTDRLSGSRSSAATPASSTGAATGRSVARQPGRTSTASTTASSPTAAAEPRTRELRAEIEHTREEMSETVNAIQERLSPSHIAEQVKGTVKHAARERARDVTESEPVQFVRANPIATAMVGIGVAGLAMLAFGDRDSKTYGRRSSSRRDWQAARWDRRRTFDDRYDDRYEETARFSGYGSSGDYTPALQGEGAYADADEAWAGRTSYRGDRDEGYWQRSGASAQAHEAGRYVQRTWNENPLLVGAASAVLGALVGLAVPETEREHQLMGEARDNMVETVQDTVRDKVNQVQQAATNAVNTVKDAATAAVGASSDSNDDDSRRS
jgi:hypothetical protein